MAWLVLGIAIFTEICWALSLKWAATIGSWQASSVPIALSFLNMGLLALAMKGLPAGTGNAHAGGFHGADRHRCNRHEAIRRCLRAPPGNTLPAISFALSLSKGFTSFEKREEGFGSSARTG
jgi:hypothetical protein